MKEGFKKRACPKKSWPLLTYEKHLGTKVKEILLFPNILFNSFLMLSCFGLQLVSYHDFMK